jgi:Co/Zn/Cd efflux system component
MNMTLRKAVALVAILNLSYFVVEFLFSHLFDSLSLLSDSLDFLEDASINLLILIAFSWSLLARKRLSYHLAGILLIPGIVFIFQAITQF